MKFKYPTISNISLFSLSEPFDTSSWMLVALVAIQAARTKVQAEIAEMKSKLELAKTTNTKFKDEIMKVQKEQGLEPTIF